LSDLTDILKCFITPIEAIKSILPYPSVPMLFSEKSLELSPWDLNQSPEIVQKFGTRIYTVLLLCTYPPFNSMIRNEKGNINEIAVAVPYTFNDGLSNSESTSLCHTVQNLGH
jgi:hypothetical protein